MGVRNIPGNLGATWAALMLARACGESSMGAGSGGAVSDTGARARAPQAVTVVYPCAVQASSPPSMTHTQA
jgi:hypothetical protein